MRTENGSYNLIIRTNRSKGIHVRFLSYSTSQNNFPAPPDIDTDPAGKMRLNIPRSAVSLPQTTGEYFPVDFPGPESPQCSVLHRVSDRHSSRAVIFVIIAAILLIPASAAIIADNNSYQEPEGIPLLISSGKLPDNLPGPAENAVDGPGPGSIPANQAGKPGNVTLPFIACNTTPGMISRQYSFRFQQTNITIATRVSNAVYYGAKNGDKFALAPPRTAPELLAPDYYRAFVDTPHQDPFYAELLQGFRSIRREHQYSDDEYLELLTVFVQSLPYDNEAAAHPDTLPRFPVETIVDGTGDCDDKSVLLAGHLSREGYNVSLLLFIPEHHMAVGVPGDRMQYRDTGYIFVETTDVSFMGDVPRELNQSVKYVPPGQVPEKTPITSLPLVIRVGSGSKIFTSAEKTEYILLQKRAVDARIALLRAHLETTPLESPSLYKTLRQNYYTYTGIHTYIAKHEQDRVGTYRYLNAQMSLPFSIGSSVGDRTCPVSLTGDENALPIWYIPCPRGVWVPQRCVWQSVRQGFVSSCP
jgi:hypothetical protein